LKLKGILTGAGIAAVLASGLLAGIGNAATSGSDAPTDVSPVSTTAPPSATVSSRPMPSATVAPSTTRGGVQAPRAVVVRPKGAPETGDGTLADLVSSWG
jgi:hypothetical protein